jgi:hypothetical protein
VLALSAKERIGNTPWGEVTKRAQGTRKERRWWQVPPVGYYRPVCEGQYRQEEPQDNRFGAADAPEEGKVASGELGGGVPVSTPPVRLIVREIARRLGRFRRARGVLSPESSGPRRAPRGGSWLNTSGIY